MHCSVVSSWINFISYKKQVTGEKKGIDYKIVPLDSSFGRASDSGSRSFGFEPQAGHLVVGSHST